MIDAGARNTHPEAEELALPAELLGFYETEMTESLLDSSLYYRLARREARPEAGDCESFLLTEELAQPPELLAYDDALFGAAVSLGRAAAALQDELIRLALGSGANVLHCERARPFDGAREADELTEGAPSPCPLSAATVDRAAAILEKNRVPRLNGMYCAVVHPAAARGLSREADWIDARRADRKRFPGEIGALHGVRFLEDACLPVTEADGKDFAVYTGFFLGRDSFVIPDPEGGAAELHVRGGKKARAACRFTTYGARIENPAGVLRVMSTGERIP